MQITKLQKAFEGHALDSFIYKGRPHWIAKVVGTVLGYSDNGGRLVTKITGEWRTEFQPEKHFALIEGADLADFRAVAALADDPTESGGSSVAAKSARLMLLTEAGINRVLLLTRKPAGMRLRDWLDSDVLPELFATGSYTVGQRDDPPALPPAALDLEERRFRREALLDCADRLREMVSPESYRTLIVQATEVATGREMTHLLPALEERFQSPTQIATSLGVTVNAVGRAISAAGVRGKPEFCKSVLNTKAHSEGQVVSYLYNDRAVELVRSAIAAASPEVSR